MSKTPTTKTVKTYVCKWCGKKYQTTNGHAKRYCSDECRKSLNRAYNTKWQQARREKMTDSEKEPNRELARQSWARKTWEIWGKEADNIMTLASTKNAREAITKYLCDNFRPLSKNQTPPSLSSIAEAQAADKTIAQSLGN